MRAAPVGLGATLWGEPEVAIGHRGGLAMPRHHLAGITTGMALTHVREMVNHCLYVRGPDVDIR